MVTVRRDHAAAQQTKWKILSQNIDKAQKLRIFALLLSLNCCKEVNGFTSCRYTHGSLGIYSPPALTIVELRATKRQRDTDDWISFDDPDDLISLDDAIASLGLKQVNKQAIVKSEHLDTRKSSNNRQSKRRENKKKKVDKHIKKAVVEASPQALEHSKAISLQTQLDYSREGHASLRNFIPPEIIEEVYHDLKAYSTDGNFRRKGEDTAPFLQFYNTWRDIPSVRRLATSPLLCQAACTMLNLPISTLSPSSSVKLRLYQDSVFIKRKNKDGITPWHIDGRMMPFDTSHVITFWIPLHSIPSIDDGGTGLLFINKSHSDFSLPYWNGRGIEYDNKQGSGVGYNAYDHLTTRYGIANVGDDRIADNNPGVIGHHMPLNAGDCTIHNGWTMHCANGNTNNLTKKKNGGALFQTRYAIAISYVDSHAEIREDIPGVGKNVSRKKKVSGDRNRSSAENTFLGDAEDRASYADWIGDVLPRTQFEHEMIPDVWPCSTYHKSRKR